MAEKITTRPYQWQAVAADADAVADGWNAGTATLGSGKVTDTLTAGVDFDYEQDVLVHVAGFPDVRYRVPAQTVFAPVLSDLIVDENAPSVDFIVTGSDCTITLVLSANAVETAQDIVDWVDTDTKFSFAATLGGNEAVLDFSAVPDGTYYMHIVGQAGSSLSNVLTYGPFDIAELAIRSMEFLGQRNTGGGDDFIDLTVDIGEESASRYIVIAGQFQNSFAGTPTAQIGGVPLDLLYNDSPSRNQSFFGGYVPTGTGSVVARVTWPTAGGLRKALHVTKFENLESPTPIAFGSTTANAGFTSINVAANDFLLGIRTLEEVETLSGAGTQAPDGQRSNGFSGLFVWSGEWTIAETRANFNMGSMNLGGTKTSYMRIR